MCCEWAPPTRARARTHTAQMPQHAIRSLDVPESTKIQRQTYVILWKQSVQHIKLTFLCVCELAYQVDPDQSPPPLWALRNRRWYLRSPSATLPTLFVRNFKKKIRERVKNNYRLLLLMSHSISYFFVPQSWNSVTTSATCTETSASGSYLRAMIHGEQKGRGAALSCCSWSLTEERFEDQPLPTWELRVRLQLLRRRRNSQWRRTDGANRNDFHVGLQFWEGGEF